MADIARRVGVSRGALYHHVADRQDMAFQCYRLTGEHMRQCLGERRDGCGSSLDQIEAFVDGMLEEPRARFPTMSEIGRLRPDQRTTVLQLQDAILDDLADSLELGVARGDLRPCDGRIVAQAIIGLISWVPAQRWPVHAALAGADMIEPIKGMLRQGIAVDRGAAPTVYRAFTPSRLAVTRIFDAAAVAAARRESLLAAASWMFNLEGFGATSLHEIARARGVTSKVISHYFGSKETLVAECHRRALRFYKDVQLTTEGHQGPRVEAICAQVYALADASLREELAPLAVFAGSGSGGERVREEMLASGGWVTERSAAAYEVGCAEGSVRPIGHLRAMLCLGHGVSEWLPKCFGDAPVDLRARAVSEVVELVRIGLAPR